MPHCPKLAPVPSFFHELNLKITHTGVTLLKQNRYTSRYTGSKSHKVDINGNLKRANDLKREIDGTKEPKKKASLERKAETDKLTAEIESMQISDNCPSTEINNPQLTNTVIHKRCYTVNKKEVRGRLLAYINTQKGKKELYFWTVTFPKGTTDDLCYQVFNIWLTSLRRYHMLHEYLWVAERQPGTNTVHFHIAIPHKMPVQRANAMMRGTLKTFARRGEIPFSVSQCAHYNGVDISKNRNTKRVTNFAVKKGARALGNYLSKYVTKNDGEFGHLAWHNSRGFSCLFLAITFTVQEFVKHGFHFLLNRTKIFDGEYAKFIPWLSDPPLKWEQHLYDLNSYLQNLN